MTTSQRFCSGGGYIVGARAWLPDDPVDYNSYIPTPTIGCNHLVCGACGKGVRSWANLATTAWGRVVPAALYAHRGDGPPDHFQADDVTRTYACACLWTQSHTSQALDIDVSPGTSLFSSQWRCAGHPPGLPGDLAAALGVVDEAILAGAVEALLGRRSAQRTSLGEPFSSPCLDVWRLEAHLPANLSHRVRGIVRGQLASSASAAVLEASLSYLKFRAVPEDGRAWLAALEADPSIGHIESPDFPGRDLRRQGARLLEVLSDYEADNRLPPSPGLVSAFFDYFEHQGLNFRLASIARLAFGAVLREIAVRELSPGAHDTRALERVWSELSEGDREAAARAWAAGGATTSQREAVLAALRDQGFAASFTRRT